jgi:hypothetical protein
LEELIAMQQHHDGITGTSKHHIEADMINRMKNADKQIISKVRDMFKISNVVECDLVANNNVCVMPNNWEEFTLELYNFGAERKETIEVVLFGDKMVKPLGVSRFDLFCK